MAKFVKTILEPDDWVELRAIKPDKAQKLWSPARELNTLIRKLRKLNRDAFNIHFSPNPRKGYGLSSDESVDLCRCLFVDFDNLSADGKSLGDTALAQIADTGLSKPTAVINSGHGVHAYWKLLSPLEPGFWSDTQKRLNATVKSDPSIQNPERLMRLPGFLNTKSEPYVKCEVVYVEPDITYDIDGLLNLLVELPRSEPEPTPAKPTERPGQMEIEGRARLYAATWPGIAEGQGRNNEAYRHACQLRRDFDLPESEAWEILSKWNALNNPPLSDMELRQAFNSSNKYGKRPVGTKLNEPHRQTYKQHFSKDPLGDYQKQNRRIAAGELICLPLPWPVLSHLTRLGKPGWLVVLAGVKGARKTFFELELLRYWLAEGVLVSAYWLEGDTDDLMDRTLVQISGVNDITDMDWKRDNAEMVQELTEQYKDELDRVGKAVMVSAGLGLETLEDIAAWIESQAKAGKRAIFVDPISAATRKSHPWVSDPAFVRRAKRAARDYECTIILVTHLSKGAEEGKPDKVAGSAAYGNFSDCVLQIMRHDSKPSLVKMPTGRTEIEHNQTIYIEKTRAPGTGLRVAFDLTKSLTFTEHGVILRKGS